MFPLIPHVFFRIWLNIFQSTLFGGGWAILALAPKLVPAQSANRLLLTTITTTNINSAVDAWLSDSANATATYGDISG